MSRIFPFTDWSTSSSFDIGQSPSGSWYIFTDPQGIHHCDFRVRIADCFNKDTLFILNWVCLVLHAIALVAGVSLWLLRRKDGIRSLFMASRQRRSDRSAKVVLEPPLAARQNINVRAWLDRQSHAKSSGQLQSGKSLVKSNHVKSVPGHGKTSAMGREEGIASSSQQRLYPPSPLQIPKHGSSTHKPSPLHQSSYVSYDHQNSSLGRPPIISVETSAPREAEALPKKSERIASASSGSGSNGNFWSGRRRRYRGGWKRRFLSWRPKSVEDYLIWTNLYFFLRIFNILITIYWNTAPDVLLHWFHDLCFEAGYVGLTLYLIGTVYSTPAFFIVALPSSPASPSSSATLATAEQYGDHPKATLMPSPSSYARVPSSPPKLSTTFSCQPFNLTTPFPAPTVSQIAYENNLSTRKKLFTLALGSHYIVWGVVWCFVLALAFAYFGSKLVKILNQHLQELRADHEWGASGNGDLGSHGSVGRASAIVIREATANIRRLELGAIRITGMKWSNMMIMFTFSAILTYYGFARVQFHTQSPLWWQYAVFCIAYYHPPLLILLIHFYIVLGSVPIEVEDDEDEDDDDSIDIPLHLEAPQAAMTRSSPTLASPRSRRSPPLSAAILEEEGEEEDDDVGLQKIRNGVTISTRPPPPVVVPEAVVTDAYAGGWRVRSSTGSTPSPRLEGERRESDERRGSGERGLERRGSGDAVRKGSEGEESLGSVVGRKSVGNGPRVLRFADEVVG
ncbi:hypothetical protein BC829DRAFT_490654 [Chytridium lagenaria]|nr:hypothetical protein BC829DRAFT_490654 [Chytridium lagenaria]